MKSTKFYVALMAVALCTASATFTSCTPDEDVTPDESQEQGEITTFDQVRFFQDYLVETDSLGNIVQRVNGAPLDPVNTTELYIGVENIEEAAEIFKNWMSPDTEVNLSAPSTIDMEADLKDLDGQVQETVYFKAVDETPTLAEVTFAKGSVIKHVSKVIFIKESAWPDNDFSPFYEGDTEDSETYEEGIQTWVCIRQAKSGQSGMLMYISEGEYICGTNYIKQFASPSLAKEASKVLRKNWNSYVTYFKNANRTLDNSYYWINDHSDWWGAIYAIRLSDGDIDWFDIILKSPYKRFIQIKTFGLVKE